MIFALCDIIKNNLSVGLLTRTFLGPDVFAINGQDCPCEMGGFGVSVGMLFATGFRWIRNFSSVKSDGALRGVPAGRGSGQATKRSDLLGSEGKTFPL